LEEPAASVFRVEEETIWESTGKDKDWVKELINPTKTEFHLNNI
jgi:hypothetical protein